LTIAKYISILFTTPKKQEGQIMTTQSLDEAQGHRRGSLKPKSPIAYPWYGLDDVLELVKAIDKKGAGRLSSEAIAVEMGSSVTSGFFQARLRAGRLFGLLAQQADDMWALTERAKRILRPRSPEDKQQALREAFAEAPLFRAVQERYAGRPLPPLESLKNILEHDFRVIASRAQAAAELLLASAKAAVLLQTAGDNLYLAPPQPQAPSGMPTEANEQPLSTTEQETPFPTPPPTVPARPSRPAPTTSQTIIQLSLTSEDLEHMSPEEIQEVFQALGRIEVARKRARAGR
jgi:hypothetical protein